MTLNFFNRTFFTVFFMVTVSAQAWAEEDPILKEQVIVYDEVVKLGDIFDSAGKYKGIAVFQSPDFGEDGIVSAVRVQTAAARHGLIWTNPGGVDKLVIRRPSRRISLNEVKQILKPVIADRSGVPDSNNITITFSTGTKDIHIDSRNTSPLIVMDLWYNQQGRSFRAVIGTEESTGNIPRGALQGRADETSFVVVPSRVLTPGKEITSDDLKQVRVPVDRIRTGSITDMSSAVGKTSKYRMAANQLLRRQDLEIPKIIKVNDMVEIHFKIPGMFLRAKGKALSSGARGDTIQVLNVQSRRKIDAIVLSPGVVKPATTPVKVITQPRPES